MMIWMRSAAVMTLAATVALPGHRDRSSADTAAMSSLPAVVSPVRTADVAAQVDGDVIRLYVREGDAVMAGQALARINDRIPQAQVNLAQAAARCEADLELAQSELRQAKRIYQRLLKGRSLGVISEAEAEKAEADVEVAEARLRRVQEECRQKQLELELQQARLNAHVLTAPFDGDVLRIEQQVGSTVSQGMPVVRVADLSRLRAVVFVPYEWHADLRPGVVLPVRADIPVDRLLDAVVVSAEPVIDAATRTFRCVVEIDNRDRRLPAGFTIVVEEDHVEAMKMARRKEQTVRS